MRISLPVQSGPGSRAFIFGCVDQLGDSFSGYFLHCLQNIVDMLKVDAEESQKIHNPLKKGHKIHKK